MNTRGLTLTAILAGCATLSLVASVPTTARDAGNAAPIVLTPHDDLGTNRLHRGVRMGRYLNTSYAAARALNHCTPVDADVLQSASARDPAASKGPVQVAADQFVRQRSVVCTMPDAVLPHDAGFPVVRYMAPQRGNAGRMEINSNYGVSAFWLAARAAAGVDLRNPWRVSFTCYAPTFAVINPETGDIHTTSTDITCTRGAPRSPLASIAGLRSRYPE